MKKALLSGILLGTLLGGIQILLPYTKVHPARITPVGPYGSCGGYIDKSNVCHEPAEQKYYRGWPLAGAGSPLAEDPAVSIAKNSPKVYYNAAIILASTTILTALVFIPFRNYSPYRGMKIALLGGLVLGLALGVGQFYYTRNVSRETIAHNMYASTCDPTITACPQCPNGRVEDDVCYPPNHLQLRRGWPLAQDTYDQPSSHDSTLSMVANFLILAIGTPVVTCSALQISNYLTPRKKIAVTKTGKKPAQRKK